MFLWISLINFEILTGYPTKFGERFSFTTGYLHLQNTAFTYYPKTTECGQLDIQLPFNTFSGFPNDSWLILPESDTSYKFCNGYSRADRDIFPGSPNNFLKKNTGI